MMTKRPRAPQNSDEVPATELQERFGANFRLCRENAGYTQAQLAEISGLDQSEISRIELGKINLSLAYMQRLATIVNQDVLNLLSESPKIFSKK